MYSTNRSHSKRDIASFYKNAQLAFLKNFKHSFYQPYYVASMKKVMCDKFAWNSILHGTGSHSRHSDKYIQGCRENSRELKQNIISGAPMTSLFSNNKTKNRRIVLESV